MGVDFFKVFSMVSLFVKYKDIDYSSGYTCSDNQIDFAGNLTISPIDPVSQVFWQKLRVILIIQESGFI